MHWQSKLERYHSLAGPGFMAISRTIHIVDDNPAICRSLERLLHSAGFATNSYARALTFLAAAPQLSGDCILLNVRLPDLDGIELQARLRSMEIAIPIIMIIGHGDVHNAVLAMKSGAVDCIEKPLKNDEVLRSIDAALAADLIDAGRREVEDAAQKRVALLSRREGEVLQGLVAGGSNKIIAHDLGLSVRTIEIHRARMMARLGVSQLAHAVRLAVLAQLSRDRVVF
jgi:two-component system, LuxR family, response regulator FixJ